MDFGKTFMLEVNYKYADILELAEQQAKENRRGLWSDEDVASVDFSTDNVVNDYVSNDDSLKSSEGIVTMILAIFILVVSVIASLFNKNKKKSK